ncbi:2OG-Fe(II) oxygenase [Plastoroseomonas arctica]|uniref:2OG-Fe(II) oxygenase n=1 Tax=Plastoroseomonas arctica TaxID=1509237 RepID=A0AAF1JXW4_9PROT|nr:2OG-Fe(II) oxygenase [Plastoroseomonas arctica]MBR0654306.1 2OG-Fe(II) oxygenase [Plastoroseomonas arctica]
MNAMQEASSRNIVPISRFVNDDVVKSLLDKADQFSSASPFPHLVFDGLFSEDLLAEVHEEFDHLGKQGWREIENQHQLTLRSNPNSKFGPATQTYFDILSSAWFVNFMGELSGIRGLVFDPLMKGGGMHESRSGGKFGLHLDFSKHPVTKLDNRLVVITYLNKDWNEEYGGLLELWDVAQNKCAERILPTFGRTIVFAHTDVSLHGHPGGLNPPPGITRRSVAAYYYSNGRDDHGASASFDSYFAPQTAPSFLKVAVRSIVPPILYSMAGMMKKRLRRTPL